MKTIPVGAKGTYTLLVRPSDLANQFKDSILPPVFATPMMVMAMENAALNAVRDYLDSGESAVGTMVNVRHLAATPSGETSWRDAVVTKVDGRRIFSTLRRVTNARKSATAPTSAWSWTWRASRPSWKKRRGDDGLSPG